MRQIPLTPETARIAKRIIWFEPPAAEVSEVFTYNKGKELGRIWAEPRLLSAFGREPRL